MGDRKEDKSNYKETKEKEGKEEKEEKEEKEKEKDKDKEAKDLMNKCSLDFSKLQQLLKTVFEKVKPAKGKDIALVVGNTGSGKSTTINYLLGNKMEKRKVNSTNRLVVCESESTEVPKIGHSMDSETLFPTLYSNKNTLFHYCDTPGFQENRGNEEGVCTSIGTRTVIKLAEHVRSIIVVIDRASFQAERGVGFRNLTRTLSDLLKNPKAVASSILFVITKAVAPSEDDEGDTIETIQGLACELKISVQRKYETLKAKKNLSKEDMEDKNMIPVQLDVIDLILNGSKDNIVLLTMSSILHPKKRNDIEALLMVRNSTSIPRDEFNFNPRDENIIKFEGAVFPVVDEWNGWMTKKAFLESSIQRCQKQLKECVDKKMESLKEIDDIKNGKNNEVEMKKNVLNNRNSIQESISRAKTEKLGQISETNKLQTLKIQEMVRLEEVVLHWCQEEYIDNSRVDEPCEANKYCHVHYNAVRTFEYDGIPFSRAEWDLPYETETSWKRKAKERFAHKLNWSWDNPMGDGYHRVECYDASRGKLKIQYDSGFGMVGLVWVKVYAKKKDMIPNRNIIAKIDENIQRVSATITKLDRDIEQWDQERTRLDNALALCHEKLMSKEKILPIFMTALDELEKKISILNKELSSDKHECERIITLINNNQQLCAIIAEILVVLGYTDNDPILSSLLLHLNAFRISSLPPSL